MEDTLVGFEVAKLAKEKGFQIETSHYYFEDGELKENMLTGTNGYYGGEYSFSIKEFLENWNNKWLTKKNGDRCFGCDKSKDYFETYSTPTQSLLQRWLREEHGLIISIEPTFTYALTTNVGYYAYVKKVNKEINTLEYLYLDIYFSATYEESLEIGLLEALKLI